MSIHNTIDNYDKLLEEIYKHVGYELKWVVFPLDDKREVFWWTDRFDIKFCLTKEKLLLWLTEGDDSGDCWHNEVIRKGVYRGEQITAIEVDTNTDGNKLLMLLRNENEVQK